jgi:hypothetical protein
MYEYILAIFGSNKAVTFLVGKPLYFTFCHF